LILVCRVRVRSSRRVSVCRIGLRSGCRPRRSPSSLLDDVVRRSGCVQQRIRVLPARVVVYFVLAMCLFSGRGYEEAAPLLTDGLQRQRRWQGGKTVPSTAAIWRPGRGWVWSR